MDNLQTMDLASGDSGMVSLPPPSGNTNIEAKPPEKNMSTDNNKVNTMEMNATPIDEVMDAPILPQDPRMMPGHPQPSQPVMMAAPQQPSPPSQQQAAPQVAASKNPLNLTDDQMEALFVGVVATLAYSRPVQEKLAQMVPQFMGENGSRSAVGMVLSGIVAAILYFFGRRFVMRN
jgi:hypothetical protein